MAAATGICQGRCGELRAPAGSSPTGRS